MVGRGDGADALGVGRRPGLERPALDQQAEDTSELELRRLRPDQVGWAACSRTGVGLEHGRPGDEIAVRPDRPGGCDQCASRCPDDSG